MSRSEKLGSALERVGQKPLSRKQFMGGLLGGALLVAVPLAPQKARAAGMTAKGAAVASGAIGAYVLIAADETVTIIGPNSEMGQGTSSALPQILAEELMVDWSKVRMQLADANPAFANPLFGSQATGGSTAVRAYYEGLRKAGAQARELLVAAAMADTTVTGLGGGGRSDYVAASGVVTNTRSKASATYGKLAAAAAKLPVPANPPLLAPSTPRLIGQPLPRLDIPAKVNGSAVFGLDVRLPGMLYAAVKLAPKVGQTVGSVGNASGGAVVVRLKNEAGAVVGVAVTGATTWEAMQAAKGISVSWVDAPFTAATDSAAMKASAQALLTSATPLVAKLAGDPKKAIAAAAKQVAATYSVPYLAHATMEPLNATAQIVAGKSCEIWAPTQNQSGCVALAGALTGLPTSAITLHTTFLGGGLGRKYENDFVSYALQVALAVGGKPVKVMWPREEDFSHDAYRPAALCSFTGGLDATGKPVGITSRTVSQSIYAAKGWLPPGAVDPSAVEGVVLNGGDEQVAYSLGDSQLVEWTLDTTAHVPLGFWRSVGNSYNVFFLESFIDELAVAAGKDPLAFRASLLPSGSRELAVLQALKTASGWGTAARGVGRGVALTRCFGGTIVGQVAEVSGSLTSGIRINRITAVIDCGTVINPDTVAAQVEGAVLQGVAAALWQDMPFTAGTPARKNFNSYRMGKLREAPRIDVTIMPPNGNAPSGVGEPGLPPVAPAIGNAIAALTGTRLRSLPFFPSAVPAV